MDKEGKKKGEKRKEGRKKKNKPDGPIPNILLNIYLRK